MRKITALALLFVLSFANFGQKVTLQTQKVKPKPKAVTQKVKPKVKKTKPEVAAKTQKTPVKVNPKTNKTTVKTQKVKPKAEETPKLTTIEAKTNDGKEVMLKEDGTWAYKKPEPTPKPSPIAKASPTPKPTPAATPAPVAKTTPTPAESPKIVAKTSPTVKPSPVAKIKPTPAQCDLSLKDAPLIRGLKLGMTREEADTIIPSDRITVVNSSAIVSYPHFSNARGFEDVYQISAEFLENRLSGLEIVYDAEEVKWKNAKEFAEALSSSLNLSPGFWKYKTGNTTSAEMQCREFSIRIDSSANELFLQKINAPQKTSQNTETPKKIFKP